MGAGSISKIASNFLKSNEWYSLRYSIKDQR
jgi:hypothetical protein